METNPEPTSGKPAKRVRTGCLTCRKRRRKCDERKPVCLKCEEKSLDCRYGVNLSFRGTNAMGVGPEHARPTTQYSRIRFVNGQQRQSVGAETSARTIFEESHPSFVIEPNGVAAVLGEDDVVQDNTDDVFTKNEERYIRGGLIRPRAYEASPTPGNSLQRAAVSSITSPTNDLVNDQRRNFEDSSSRETTSTIIQMPGSIAEITEIEQLVHYRYRIAPWLDTLDWTQTFGLAVLMVAADRQHVLNAILALSDAHLKVGGGDSTCLPNYQAGILARQTLQSRPCTDTRDNPEAETVVTILNLVQDLISCSDSRSWSFHLVPVTDKLAWLSHHAFERTLLSASFWCLLRIDVGIALITGKGLNLPLSKVVLFNGPPSYSDKEDIYRYARDMLYLCAQTIKIMSEFKPSNSTQTLDVYSTDLNSRWRGLWEAIQSWYSGRPPELLPIFEGPQSDPGHNQMNEHGISQIFFMTASGSNSNMLYHTAALMLLQCKPRTVRLTPQKVPIMSMLWHCLRICSIGGAIDKESSWDLPLIGATFCAAKNLTHESQHQIVNKTLSRATSCMPGWIIKEEIKALQEQWKIAVGY